MKFLGLALCLFITGVVGSYAQDSGPKEWTPWVAVEGDWVKFAVITSFEEPPEKLAKKDLKQLRVGCLIAGRLTGEIPPELKGVKTFRVLYTEYGEFNRDGFFRESSIEVPHLSKAQYIPQVGISRKATQFDLSEASKPITELEMTTTVPTILSELGVSPFKTKIRGRQYWVGADWRRKGKTVEIKIRDYRPNVPATPTPSPTP